MAEEKPIDEEMIRKIVSITEGFGPGSKELSSRIDTIVYEKGYQKAHYFSGGMNGNFYMFSASNNIW